MKLGRRRPFIIISVVMVCAGALSQFLSSIVQSALLIKMLIYAGFALQDLSLWSMQVPLSSYTLEVFSGREQQQMMTGMVFFTGVGGIVGFYLSSVFGVIETANCIEGSSCINMTVIYGATIIFAVVAVLNIFSMPEKNLEELKSTGAATTESWNQMVNGYIKSPRCLLKLSICQFFVMYAVITHYLWFTHHYAEVVYDANLEDIKDEFNMSNTTYTEASLLSNFTERYDRGIREGSQIMILFPLSAMVFSLLIEFGNLFTRVGIRIIFEGSFILYIIVCIGITFCPQWPLFALLAISLGYFLATQVTTPYLLVDMYRERASYPKSRGLALDCAVIREVFDIAKIFGYSIKNAQKCIKNAQK